MPREPEDIIGILEGLEQDYQDALAAAQGGYYVGSAVEKAGGAIAGGGRGGRDIIGGFIHGKALEISVQGGVVMGANKALERANIQDRIDSIEEGKGLASKLSAALLEGLGDPTSPEVMAALAEANQALASTYGVGWLGGNPEDEPGGTQDLNPETDPDEDGEPGGYSDGAAAGRGVRGPAPSIRPERRAGSRARTCAGMRGCAAGGGTAAYFLSTSVTRAARARRSFSGADLSFPMTASADAMSVRTAAFTARYDGS